MAIDANRVYTTAERVASRPRCPDCRATLATTWRRARHAGRSEDLCTIAKTSCPNRCDFDPDDI